MTPIASVLLLAVLAAAGPTSVARVQMSASPSEVSTASHGNSTTTSHPRRTGADSTVAHAHACLVPNLGQWRTDASFVHRRAGMDVLLDPLGWSLHLRTGPQAQPSPMRDRFRPAPLRPAEPKGRCAHALVRMSFVDAPRRPTCRGEGRLPGHHNYILGNDPAAWCFDVPLYSGLRYRDVYPGVDVRFHVDRGVPEYDLLLEPEADLSRIAFRVEGARSIRVDDCGALVIETAIGGLTLRAPRTWQRTPDGLSEPVECSYVLLGPDAFGFAAPAWSRTTTLTIDPELIWSTYVGGSLSDRTSAVDIGLDGNVTIAGETQSADFPTTPGAGRTFFASPSWDAFITVLDPRKAGAAQLIYSTFIGGRNWNSPSAVDVDDSGIITLVGITQAVDFPTTTNAWSRSYSGGGRDGFVLRLDPTRVGAAQLVYSTFLGGKDWDWVFGLAVDSAVVTVAGSTLSNDFPTSPGAYASTLAGFIGNSDAFVTQLDTGRAGAAQLVYSTLLGGPFADGGLAVAVEPSGLIDVAGVATTGFPTTSGAFARLHAGSHDVFVSTLDPKRSGAAQLMYSTLFGSLGNETPMALAADGNGLVTVAGYTDRAAGLPVTANAFDSTYKYEDAFVCRLDRGLVGSAQLVYSSFVGGSKTDWITALHCEGHDRLTLCGWTTSADFPITPGAYDATLGGVGDAFITRLDLGRIPSKQLLYSTFFGGEGSENAEGLVVDPAGTAMVVGDTTSLGLPTTPGAYSRSLKSFFGSYYSDAFVARLAMGASLWADRYELSVAQGGRQRFTLDAGPAHGNKLFLLVGTNSGTAPGIPLAPTVTLPLNPDPYFSLTLLAPNSTLLTNSLGVLDGAGAATASWNVIPQVPLPSIQGFELHHAYVVIGPGLTFDFASNPVPLRLVQ